MKTNIRIIAILLCIVMVLSMVLSAAFIITSTDHECTGEECEICHNIHNCERTLKSVLSGLCYLLAMLFMVKVSVPTPVIYHQTVFNPTLISMKVKFSC